MGYRSAGKCHEVLFHAATWINLKVVMLGEGKTRKRADITQSIM
jgi:hypothetical protein